MADRLFHLPGKSNFVHDGGKARNLRMCNLGCQSAPKFDSPYCLTCECYSRSYSARTHPPREKPGRPAGDADEQV
jgi:hypothetical protein